MQIEPKTYQNVLVIAASGKTGGRVADLLDAREINVVRGSRTPRGDGWVAFDWADKRTWTPALSGVDSVYVVYTPDLTVPGGVEDITRFVEVAKAAGVKKLVLLSGRGEPEAKTCEQLVMQSGLAWTVVSAAWFDQNFSEGGFAPMVGAGVIALPMGDTVEPMVDADDIAEVAAAALVDARHDGELYEVTGPELLSHHDIAQHLAEVTGQPVRYEPITEDEFRASMQGAGVPEAYTDLLSYLFRLTNSGVNAYVADGVERALGRKPRRFREFAEREIANAKAGRS